ncbi:hypothetical protein EDB92DRAFT_1812364 [Lactarius akahatsu]|uniref:Uncharacterized protein n=1 Tax=Lactarius akahatsu TaxID=416441 RepID=A0AAD4LUT4_9AGAM|nr:hypothetical protein EDB92DRAFT_1812364 [Lactarius akahatsu]
MGIPQVFATAQKLGPKHMAVSCGIPANMTPTLSINIPDAHLVGRALAHPGPSDLPTELLLQPNVHQPRSKPFLPSQTYTAQSSVCAQSSDDRSSSSGPIHHVPKAPRRHLTNEPADGTLDPTHLPPTTSPPTTIPDGHNHRLWIMASKIPHSAHLTPPYVGAFHQCGLHPPLQKDFGPLDVTLECGYEERIIPDIFSFWDPMNVRLGVQNPM